MKKFKEKKMKKLLVLLFVAAMCIPSYAAVNTNIIVYKFTRTFDPWIDYSDGTQAIATNVGTQQMTGYLVLNADVNTDANTWGLNADPTLIFYGGTGSNKWCVSFDVNDDVDDATGYMDTKLFSLQGNTAKSKGLLFVIDANTEQERVGASYSTLYGKTGKLDIGKGALHKEGVPSSMKGIVEGWAETVDSFEGFGNTTMTLNSIYTKWANKTGAAKTQAETVTKIIEDSENLGYFSAGALQARIDAALLGRAAGYPHVTITVPAGTYHESIVINEPNVMLKSASGKATTFIDPGASYQQAIEISDSNVTIDGFTVKHGTQAYTAAHPEENTIWVHDANYSTIKNCTIIGRGGSAGIFIGGRVASEPNGGAGKIAIWGYNVATGTEHHTIQDNTFRNAYCGQGWGIFAVKLTDDCLIHGNTFDGDAADVWDTADQGAPGTAIIIHSATNGTGGHTYAATIEYNTAKYVKYSWLTFTAFYPFNEDPTDVAPGKFYEQPEASTVEDVLVRYNTIHDLGRDWTHNSGSAITFSGQDKDTYIPANTNITIGAGKVTIKNNTLSHNECGVEISGPTTYDDTTYGCVINADNITIDPNNSIYDNTYGVYNGTTEDFQTGGHKTIDAMNNWWGVASGPYNYKNHPAGHGNPVTDHVDVSPHRTTVPPR